MQTVDGADGARAAMAPGVKTGTFAVTESNLIRTQFVQIVEV
jgi:hypothetical protein